MHLIVDIESTGFSAKKHSIIEIGWAWVDNDFQSLSEDTIFIFPQEGKESSQEALDVTGYTEDLWREQGAVTLAEAQLKLQNHIKHVNLSAPLTAWAHNAPFDKAFVELNFPFMSTFVSQWNCSMELFKGYYKSKGIPIVGTVKDPTTKKVITYGSATLNGCCKTAGVPYERAHGGLDDVRSTIQCLQWAHAQGLA